MAPVRITGFHQDEEGHWVAELSCGHQQHMRHDPPWQNRPWVITPEGRASFIGTEIPCSRCESPSPRDANAGTPPGNGG